MSIMSLQKMCQIGLAYNCLYLAAILLVKITIFNAILDHLCTHLPNQQSLCCSSSHGIQFFSLFCIVMAHHFYMLSAGPIHLSEDPGNLSQR